MATTTPAQSRIDQSDDRERTTAPPGTLKANEQGATVVDRHLEATLEQFKQLNFILGDCVL